jgi:hypothetical protein
MGERRRRRAGRRAAVVGCAWLALCAAARPARGGNWSERARRMNRTELSAAEARERSGREDVEHRNKIRMRRIRPAMPGVDWNCDPTAIPYVLYQVNKRTELPVAIDNDGLDVASDQLFEETIVYLTSHGRWGFNETETANMARWLKRGGTLFLDDCYLRGSPFSDSVRPEVSKLIPGAEPRMLLEEDPLVADTFKMIYPTPWPGRAAFENRPWQYFVLDDRPAVFFSPNDDGCGWEISTPPSASNPIGEGIGHGGDNRQREVMYQWAANWFMFVLTH